MTELAVAHRYTELGWEVYWPDCQGTPVDLLVRCGSVVHTVQVKTAHVKKSGRVRVHTRCKQYTPRSFDWLATVDDKGVVRVVPWAGVCDRLTLNVREEMSPL